MLAVLSATTAFGFGMMPSSRRKIFYFREIQVGDFFNPIDPLITTNILGFGRQIQVDQTLYALN